MTTPGGVPNLPQGALTLATMASDLQDMSGTAMKSRAVQRFPNIFNTSTGLNPASDLTPFGILTGIWAQVNSLIANADPASIQGPQDLPPLVLQFIEGLPLVGQFIGILEAILGTYTGTDTTLLQVQAIFDPIRKLMQLVGGVSTGFPTLTQLTNGWALVPLLSGGLLSGSVIPILPLSQTTGLLGLFGGATTPTQAANYNTNLLALFGAPTLTGSPGSFNPATVLGGIPFGIPNTSIIGLNGVGNLGGTVQDLIDNGVQGIIGGVGTGYFLSDWKTALQAIPSTNVLGIGGIPDLGSTQQQTWDTLYQALSSLTGSNQPLSAVASAAHDTANAALNAQNHAVLNSNLLSAFVGARPANHGLDPTAVASYNLASNSNTPLNATSTVAPMSFKVITQPTTFGNFETVATKSGTVSNFYLNVYKMDAATGALNQVYNSADLQSQLVTTSPGGWVRTGAIALANQPTFLAGEIMAVESVVVGSGSVALRSQSTGIPDHPTTLLKNFAASRNPTGNLTPTTIAAGAVAFSANQPWHSATVLAVPAGWVPPVITPYTTPGTYTFTIPAFAKVVGAKLDLWCVGSGGGGQANYGTLTWWTGGNAGTWASQTLVCGTDYPPTATSLTVVVGVKGLGAGAYFTNGHPGNISTITWTDPSSVVHTITGNGGAGGGNAGTSGTNGKSPGNSPTLGGVTQFGGTAVGGNATGSPPGGGGGGAGPYQTGGNAADGGAWIQARQS